MITVNDLTQAYGSRKALDAVSLEIPKATVVGLLGPNGAGKTSLISILAGLSRPTSGQLLWDGTPVESPFRRDLRRQIGMVTQETALYSELTVRQNLRYSADLFSVPNPKQRVEEAMELMAISHRAKDRAGVLSGGMQRRVALTRALLHKPSFLILDEPTLGVDVEARHALWGHIRSLRREGMTVLISTNHLDEAEALCDHIFVLREGKLITDGAPADLLSRTGRCVEVDCSDGEVAELRRQMSVLAGVKRIDVTDVGLTVLVEHGQSPEPFTALAIGSGVAQSVRVRAPDMVEVFQSLTTASASPAPAGPAPGRPTPGPRHSLADHDA